MGPGPTHALLNAVGSAIDALLRMKTPAPERWTENPFLFDHVIRAFTAALEMFRPEGPVPQEEPKEIREFHRLQGRAALLELLAAASTTPAIPLEKQSSQQRALSMMKQDLSELVERPILRELILLAQKAAKNPNEVVEQDARELWRFIGWLAEARAIESKRVKS
jgi:hypothetical protein